MSNVYEVSAVVFTRPDGSVLLAQRGRKVAAPWSWEFPGGKLEENESAVEAAIRESEEETGFKPAEDDLTYLGTIEHDYDEDHVTLHFYSAPWRSVENPTGPDHEQFRWLSPDPQVLRQACRPLLSATDRFLDTATWDQFTRELNYDAKSDDDAPHDVVEEDVHREITALEYFLRESPTAYQAAANIAHELTAAGFEELPWSAEETDDLTYFEDILANNDAFFIRPGGSSVIAFLIGEEGPAAGTRIWGAHLDSPSLQIKGDPMVFKAGSALLSASVYAGPILNSFFDRPLSLAGSVILRDDTFPTGIRQELVDLSPLTILIPNLAIHQNREVNKGVEIQPQKVMLPILGTNTKNDPKALHGLLAKELGCSVGDILDFDLYTYPTDPPHTWGAEQEFFLAPRLDNLAMSFAGLRAFIEASQVVLVGEGFPGVSVLYLTDHEEVGSNTMEGAGAAKLRPYLETLARARGLNESAFLGSLNKSFAISADAAHAVHPHHGEVADPTQRPVINGGITIKYAVASYATNARSAARVKLLCEQAGIPYQSFSNRADQRGGSTIGPMLSTQLPIDNVDVGIPMWSMHSLYETMGVKDQARCVRLAAALFEV